MITSMIQVAGDDAKRRDILRKMYDSLAITCGDTALGADSIVCLHGYDVYIFNNNYRGTDIIKEVHLSLYRDPQGISTIAPIILKKSLEVAAFVICTRIILLGDYINPYNNTDRS